MIAVIKNGVYTGLVYERLSQSIINHHTEYGDIFGEVERAISEGDIPTTKEISGALWLIHKRFQSSRIDAEGLLGMYHKVSQGGVKAMANIDWVNVFWNTIYYPRKMAVENETATLDPSLYDMSNYPQELPYSYYEAMSEEVQ